MKTTTDVSQSARSYHDAISARAREIWRARGEPSGEDVEIWLQAERDLVASGAIPASPPPPLPRSARRTKVAADEIDERELADRLDAFGDRGARSPTSLDPGI
ncbi:DUF2934 domain-containing protein [Opitutus terrae]|uniref:DUF2934 domain-containing protein n=1 Tax=Opitutus terrae (strain DSM 11246 / JCM 15787 / PB90-1) TaxID=452637 RepID=B1ZQY4_OPITP|nr:DUF2934 domain-containing protein [Opitutus terrae]ACB73651.1 hypothetical protein Oter_0361 [Opitutus terrae PB90-1]